LVPELGHLSLAFAAALSLIGCITGFVGARLGHAQLQASTVSLTVGQFVFVLLSFAALIAAFVTDDFSVAYVASHSNTILPWYYKASAAWGGHEGSFLLWILIMTVWMVVLAFRGKHYPASLFTNVLAVLCLLNLGFICFALFTSNPFERLIPLTPADGGDLNPQLQDFGFIVHPPFLYVGYVGLAVPFAFALAALLERKVDAAWARWSRTWANIAWAFLTVGIALGSWWAYYELGWGGWWFWDPVENASFMPWLAATALIHSLAVTEKRGTFKSWTLLLAITAFSLCLLGAFIVRSGVLTSVHAFAVDPERGTYILIFLALVVGASLTLYAARAGSQWVEVSYGVFSREFFMLINNLILVVSLAVVLWGTLAPIGYEAVSGEHYSIGPPFFNMFFVPLMLALSVALALVPALNWKKTSFADLRFVVTWLLGASAVIAVIAWFIVDPMMLSVAAALGLALWIAIGHGYDVVRRIRKSASLPRAYLGMTAAHLGFAMSVAGIAVTATLSTEEDVRMAPQETRTLGFAEVRFLGVTGVTGPNYSAQEGIFLITKEDGDTFELRPQKRRYVSGNVMTEASIRPGFFSDTYISLGEPLADGAWAVRLHYKPMVRWVWLGALLMALGAGLATLDRRYRRIRERERSRLETAGQTAQAEPAS
jgi:cytochrome c-type biogenesis protein CcmF